MNKKIVHDALIFICFYNRTWTFTWSCVRCHKTFN